MADDNTLWVGGLADEVTEDHLYELFLQAGPLQKVTRAKEKDGTLKKFAFVEFTHADSVPYAIQVMEGVKLFNHHLRLKGRTGSSHDARDSSGSQGHSHSDHRGSRGGSDYHRSRSYQGGNRSGDDRRGNRSFNSSNSLSQPFSNFSPYNGPNNMQPQSFEERRNRVLHKQSMSMAAHGQQQSGRNSNYSQSFSGYGQQNPQWYRDNY